MIFFTISGFFKAFIALPVVSNGLGVSAIFHDLENREICQLKLNKICATYQTRPLPMAALTSVRPF